MYWTQDGLSLRSEVMKSPKQIRILLLHYSSSKLHIPDGLVEYVGKGNSEEE
jgi:hypothetical protein